jgi:hypothetical protein
VDVGEAIALVITPPITPPATTHAAQAVTTQSAFERAGPAFA